MLRGNQFGDINQALSKWPSTLILKYPNLISVWTIVYIQRCSSSVLL